MESRKFFRKLFFILFIILKIISPTYSQTTNVCGNIDCSVISSLKYSDLCKKPSDIIESTRTKICSSSYTGCSGIGCKTICNCKVYTVANCCYYGKQCTSDFVKVVCGSLI